MFQTQKTKVFWIAVALSVLAGIAYNSWPLGYLLNPLVGEHGLASELEALHQPYNWLFVLLDILSGLFVTTVAVLLWRRTASRLYRIVLVNFALFGIFTAISAALPLKCEPSLTVCPSFTHQPLLILHGVASIASSVCLFVSVCMVWWHKRQTRGAIMMYLLLLGWVIFGLVSAYFFFVPGPGYLAQHYYITLCSLWVMLLPFMFEQRKPVLLPRYKLARAHLKR